MRQFLSDHRVLVMKHARSHVRSHNEKIPAEDVAREMELEATQLAHQKKLTATGVTSPDAFFRSLVKHATGRARRRRKLVEQIAAGDDLQELTIDLAALDADLPQPFVEPTAEAKAAREKLDQIQDQLTARDRLVFSLLISDDGAEEDVARALALRLQEIEVVSARVDALAKVAGIEPPRTEGSVPPMRTSERDRELRRMARIASDRAHNDTHVDEPVLALLRDGDQSADLDDAVTHVADCADCRASLTEGHLERRSVVVVAIEAPRASQSDLQKAADGSHARLLERGEGRYVAVVDASHAEELKERLEKPESSVVSRLAVGTPFEVPVEELRAARQKMKSSSDLAVESGTDAAEVQAWAQVANKPKQKTPGVSPGWTLFAIAAIGGAIALAYFLATR